MISLPAERTLTLSDGRGLGYAEYGKPDGAPAFYFHGHPGSRLEPLFAADAPERAGLRLIALDRPGYGLSDLQAKRTLRGWAKDVSEVADQLGFETFSVVGSSGGGPYALACAYELSGRVTKAGVISGVGPYDAPGATAGMRRTNRIGFQLGARVPPLARLLMWSMARQLRKQPERVVDAVAAAMSPSDAAIVRRHEVREVLVADLREGFRQGSNGPARDVVLLGRRWGFRLEDIKPPVNLWQGEEDTLVPPAMGRHMAKAIPDCRATFYPGEGHLLVVDHIAEIIEQFAG